MQHLRLVDLRHAPRLAPVLPGLAFLDTRREGAAVPSCVGCGGAAVDDPCAVHVTTGPGGWWASICPTCLGQINVDELSPKAYHVETGEVDCPPDWRRTGEQPRYRAPRAPFERE